VLTRDNIPFYLAGGVSLFGGFAGTETSVAARVQGANTTLLSGDIGVAMTIQITVSRTGICQ